jgi:phosphatidylglycerophosphatase A
VKPDSLQRLLLTAGGLGLLRPAPGTWGSLPSVLIAFLLAQEGASISTAHPDWVVNAVLIVAVVAASIICIVCGESAERMFGRKDPSQVVADEVAGQAMTLLALPWRYAGAPNQLAWNASLATIAFLAFRIMDIAKPSPARGLQRLPAGWGILIDDLVAAAYAAGVVQLVARLVMPAVGFG